VDESTRALRDKNPYYFGDLLPANERWRLFPEFRDSTVYLDIETTGLGSLGNYITTIALYDGKKISWYVHNRNLGDFERDVQQYTCVVTYNGRCFDLPFIKSCLAFPIEHVHIDLRFVLRSLGFSGGLKGCEKMIGLDRAELEGVDGYFAVLLWEEYLKKKNERALETLLAYNIMDVVNLEVLMVSAYNLKLQTTPFAQTHSLSPPTPAALPFRADQRTIEKIRMQRFQ
jgi:uncharacterized protein YprB with RNaseH-like and TPR domain